jgi:ubiquinone/menaquinone biosynthesis C-methylase UbiE
MENIRFTFSQGVRDIQATLDFLERSPDYRPSRTVLVSFSGASIDSRRAVALEGGRRIDGWVSVVGSADLQSMMRVISGGVDYLGGVERGVQFGFQGVLGLTVDVDTSSRDALAHKMAFLEDARRDFAKIRVPITWVHGRHDAWMNLERVRHVLSFGDTSRRRILEVPTGHQLKSSREALGIFQLIAREVSQIALGRSLTPRLPDLVELGRRRQAERDRLPIASVNVKQFWRDYLVGRDGSLGMELLTSTKTYREFIASQIQALSLREGDRVLDLGSGTGSFPRQLTACLPDDRRVEIIELDYVREALLRTRARLEATPAARNVSVRYVECDLAPRSRRASIALASNSSDAALGALLLNYLANPVDVLREVHRVLRPGGRLVLSSLKRDADISKICVEGVKELRSGLAREAFGNAGERVLDESIRMFMSDAARLLDLEELGIFQFWDPPELRQMVEAVGFEVVELRPAFGDPAQALVLTARRP